MNQDDMLNAMDINIEYTVLELASKIYKKHVKYKDIEHLTVYHKIKPLYKAKRIKKELKKRGHNQILYITRIR